MMNGAGQELHRKAVAIAELLPTQVTVGMREVAIKRRRWRERTPDKGAHYLCTHSIPVLIGPEQSHYIIDRHHLTRALYDEGVSKLVVSVVADMSALGCEEFWATLESRNWTHPFDGDGRRCSYRDIPRSVCELADDPFRSLAGALKRAGGYTKDKAPFSEFRWADFLRTSIPRETIECDFDQALSQAMELARSPAAAALPGLLGNAPARCHEAGL